MDFPIFKYHRDPIKTGMIEPSEAICECCNQAKGFLYTANIYCIDEISDICPWCIADGSAAKKFNATFSDVPFCEESVDAAVIDEITKRTPGFHSWQGEYWCVCCNDGCCFLGAMGADEIRAYGEEAIDAIQSLFSPDTKVDANKTESMIKEEIFNQLTKNGHFTAYLFQCLHCGAFDGYTDCS